MRKGWQVFPFERSVADWAAAALGRGREAVAAPEFAQWHQCEGTWFVGVDALPNDASGAVDGVPLRGAARDAADALFGPLALHRAQLSVIYAGYPRPRKGEGEAAFRFRQKRDAAHLDGLRPSAARRRFMEEYHGYILGIPLTQSAQSPMVIWEGSHLVFQKMLREAFADRPAARWHEVDLTDVYKATRAEIFETCQRVELRASPGEAYLVHRFALHGVAPWDEGAKAGPDGRMIAYFRPELPDRGLWLNAP